ncbi:MAG: ECF transporter S component [Infirmifilum sp.]
MNSRELAVAAVFVSLSVSLRIVKNALTSIQFLNIPLLFALVASAIYGSKIGFLVGFFSYFLSDLMIFPGIWTLVNSTCAGLTAFFYHFVAKSSEGKTVHFVVTFLFLLAFDVITSTLLYIAFGLEFLKAVIFSFVGLFLPVMGGYLIGVGPLTEALTSLLVVLLIEEIIKRKI